MIFPIMWLICFICIMIAMTIDNFFWISASPEYPRYKKYSLKQKLNYIWFKRVIPVWTAWRDLVPAVITSFLLTLVVRSLQ